MSAGFEKTDWGEAEGVWVSAASASETKERIPPSPPAKIAFIEDYKVAKKILDHLDIYEFDKKRAPPKVAENPVEFDEHIIDDYIDSDHVC